MERLAYKISRWLLEKEYIDDFQIEDIRFAIEVVISNLSSFFSILIIGIAIREYLKTILFFIVFIGFGTIKDRYHAETFVKCYFLTVGSFLFCLVVSNLIKLSEINVFTFYTVFINLISYIIHMETVENYSENKSDMLFKYCFIFYNILCLALVFFSPSSYSVFVSILGTIILLTVINNPKKDN